MATSSDTNQDGREEQSQDAYIVEIQDTFRVPADEVANSAMAEQHLLESIGSEYVPTQASVTSVAGVAESVSKFIATFGDSGTDDNNDRPGWIIGDEITEAWVPPTATHIGSTPLAEYEQTQQVAGITVTKDGTEIEAKQLRNNPEDPLRYELPTAHLSAIADAYNVDVSTVAYNTKLAEDQLVLVDLPDVAGYIAVAPLKPTDDPA